MSATTSLLQNEQILKNKDVVLIYVNVGDGCSGILSICDSVTDVSRPCIINQLCMISIIHAKKSQKLGFWLLNQVCLSSGKAVCWGHCLI